jgi:hypothetical protein
VNTCWNLTLSSSAVPADMCTCWVSSNLTDSLSKICSCKFKNNLFIKKLGQMVLKMSIFSICESKYLIKSPKSALNHHILYVRTPISAPQSLHLNQVTESPHIPIKFKHTFCAVSRAAAIIANQTGGSIST